MVDNEKFLSPFQEKQMSFQPDFILEYAHFLGKNFSDEFNEIEVYAESFVALNGRPSQRFIDPRLIYTLKESHLKIKHGYCHLMMKSKVFKILILLYLSIQYSYGQNRVFGTVKIEESENQNSIVFIYDGNSKLLTETNENGFYEFYTEKKEMNVIFLLVGSQYIEEKIIIKNELELNVVFEKQTKVLSEVIIKGQKIREFELQRLNDVEGTSIYAGKKTEVILVDQSMANLASNNSRQIYSQISGLNIYQNDDAGIQLHIGGRGLDPNRTSNFSTRQNGYDISADVLGYPESYYTPPAEAIKNIQIIRGAASLQYGTQFGGLINFIMKEPPNKNFEFITRNSIGSNLLFTNFTSVGGKNKKFSYFSYYNFKRGNGFRQNSRFNSNNFYIHFNYAISTKASKF